MYDTSEIQQSNFVPGMYHMIVWYHTAVPGVVYCCTYMWQYTRMIHAAVCDMRFQKHSAVVYNTYIYVYDTSIIIHIFLPMRYFRDAPMRILYRVVYSFYLYFVEPHHSGLVLHISSMYTHAAVLAYIHKTYIYTEIWIFEFFIQELRPPVSNAKCRVLVSLQSSYIRKIKT